VEPVRTTASRYTVASGLLSDCPPVALSLVLLLHCLPAFAIQHQPGDRDNPPPAKVAAADTLEPNDSPGDASLLGWGGESGNEARSGPANISRGLDLDFYAVELEAGDSLVAAVAVEEAGVNVLAPAVSILDSAGTAIASDMLTPGVASVSVAEPGRYLVLVTDRSLLDGSPFTGEARGYELLLSRHLRRGDVDGSGELDYRDAFVVFMLSAGLLNPETVSSRVLEAADLDGDGMVAGDMDDFRLLISRVEIIPSRDPQSGGKQKNSGDGTRLALADGSVVELSGGGKFSVLLQGELAGSAASLWSGLTGNPLIPEAAQPGLEQNSPNPLNPSTTISFSLPGKSHVSLAVYSARGQLVRTLAAGDFNGGRYQVHWDGADSRGRRVASGVYFYRLQAGDTMLTRKLVVLK
jgi:hypothetical protein